MLWRDWKRWLINLERFSNILWVFTVPHEKFKQMVTRLRWNSSSTKLSKFSTPRDMFSWLSFPPREPDTLHWTPDARSWPARGWKTGGWDEIGRAGARCQDIRFRILVLAAPCFSDNQAKLSFQFWFGKKMLASTQIVMSILRDKYICLYYVPKWLYSSTEFEGLVMLRFWGRDIREVLIWIMAKVHFRE